MDFEAIFGWIFFGFGILSAALYLIEWIMGNDMSRVFSKRRRYIERMGKTAGTIWHIVSYVVLPIGMGMYLLLQR